GRATKVVEPNRQPERNRQEDAYRDIRCAQIFRTHKQNRGAKGEEERPDKTDNAPRSLVLNVGVDDQGADSIDCQITQAEVLELLAKHAQNQHWEFVTEEVRPADFPR